MDSFDAVKEVNEDAPEHVEEKEFLSIFDQTGGDALGLKRGFFAYFP